jgi:hypothetical protein
MTPILLNDSAQLPYSDMPSSSRADFDGTDTPWMSDGDTGRATIRSGTVQWGAIRAQSPRSAARSALTFAFEVDRNADRNGAVDLEVRHSGTVGTLYLAKKDLLSGSFGRFRAAARTG